MSTSLSRNQVVQFLDVLTQLFARARAGGAGVAGGAAPLPASTSWAAPAPVAPPPSRSLPRDLGRVGGNLGTPATVPLPGGPLLTEGPGLKPNPTWAELVQALETNLGPGNWSKKKKHGMKKRDMLVNSSLGGLDAMSQPIWGPKTTKYLREAYNSLLSGDISRAKENWSSGAKTSSPVMLDLNGDGKLGTTGVSTAKNRVDGQVGRTVAFDIDGDGDLDDVEWMGGQGDGMLVDDTDGGATAAMHGDGRIDGKRLFGDQGGAFANGYEKLARHDLDGDGQLTGRELEGLKTWVDDGDAKLEEGELKSLAELGVTQLSTGMKTEKNARGEDLMRSSFVRNGKTQVTEDVWFAKRA